MFFVFRLCGLSHQLRLPCARRANPFRLLDGGKTVRQHRFAHVCDARLREGQNSIETVLITHKHHGLRDFYGRDGERFLFGGVGDCNFHFRFSFGVVAAVRGDMERMQLLTDLSIKNIRETENNFSFFACQPQNPTSHKAFPRFHAGKQPGKNFGQIPANGRTKQRKTQSRSSFTYLMPARKHRKLD